MVQRSEFPMVRSFRGATNNLRGAAYCEAGVDRELSILRERRYERLCASHGGPAGSQMPYCRPRGRGDK